MIDNETVWFDMEQDLEDGKTPLLVASAADWLDTDVGPSTIRLLLQRGANVAARDPLGRTCLHFVLTSGFGRRYSDSFLRRMNDSLILLVEAGANIHAVDKDNCSVSEYAIKRGRWDIWEAVLRNCGKDVHQVRAEMREKGHCMPGDPDCGKSSGESECGGLCRGESEIDSNFSESDTTEGDEDDDCSEEGDAQPDIQQTEARNETNEFRDGSDSDSDCSMGGAELSFEALLDTMYRDVVRPSD